MRSSASSIVGSSSSLSARTSAIAAATFPLDTYSHVIPGLQEDAAARVAALIVSDA
jgi:hypothetical protein